MTDSIARLRSISEREPIPEELFIVLDDLPALLDCAEMLQKLTFVARTSGGTAGRDDDLVAACEQAEAALTALNGDSHAG